MLYITLQNEFMNTFYQFSSRGFIISLLIYVQALTMKLPNVFASAPLCNLLIGHNIIQAMEFKASFYVSKEEAGTLGAVLGGAAAAAATASSPGQPS